MPILETIYNNFSALYKSKHGNQLFHNSKLTPEYFTYDVNILFIMFLNMSVGIAVNEKLQGLLSNNCKMHR